MCLIAWGEQACKAQGPDSIKVKVEGHTLIGSLSESGGTSATTTEVGFITDAGFTVVLRLDGFGSGEVFLFTSGFRAVVIFAGIVAAIPAAAFDTARVVRGGAGGSATREAVFVREEERVAFGLPAMVVEERVDTLDTKGVEGLRSISRKKGGGGKRGGIDAALRPEVRET